MRKGIMGLTCWRNSRAMGVSHTRRHLVFGHFFFVCVVGFLTEKGQKISGQKLNLKLLHTPVKKKELVMPCHGIGGVRVEPSSLCVPWGVGKGSAN